MAVACMGGVHLNTVFSSLNIDLMLITRSFAFQAIKNSYAHQTRSYVVGYFAIFFGDFLGIFGKTDNFSQMIS